jgi:hypothetical protein
MPAKSIVNKYLRIISGPVQNSTDACFELLGFGDVKMSLLDDCRPGKMAATISALATDRCFQVFHSQGLG